MSESVEMNSQRNGTHSVSHWMDIWASAVTAEWNHRLVIWVCWQSAGGDWMMYGPGAPNHGRSSRWSAYRKGTFSIFKSLIINFACPHPHPPHFAWTIVSYAPRRIVSKSVWKQQLLKNWGRGGGEGEGASRVFYEWFNIQNTNRSGTPESLWKIKRSWSTGPNTGYKWRLSSAYPSFDPKIMIKS